MPTPLPKKKPTQDLTFYDALREVMTGKSITKKEWGSKKIYGYLKDDYLTLHKADNKDYHWILNSGDLHGDDYVVL